MTRMRGEAEAGEGRSAPPHASLRAVERSDRSRLSRRSLVALLAALGTSLAVTGGLLSLVPALQVALLVGGVGGMLAPDARRAAMIGPAAVVLGRIFGPHSVSRGLRPMSLWEVVAAACLAAVFAAGAARLSARPKLRVALPWGAVALIVVDLWVAGVSLASAPLTDNWTGSRIPSLFMQLDAEMSETLSPSDQYLFFRVLRLQDRGSPYYAAFASASRDHYGPNMLGSPIHVRMPTLFWFWTALGPRHGRIILAYLLLAGLAVLSVLWISGPGLGRPLGVVGAAAVATYLLFFAAQPVILDGEPWAAACALLSAGSLALSFRSARWRGALVSAVLWALLAALVREIAAFVLLAGVVSSFAAPPGQRRVRIAAWSGGALAFAAAYGAHIVAARPYLVHAEWVSKYVLAGGVEHLWAGLTYGALTFGNQPLYLAGLAVVGLAGAAALRSRPMRRFALWCLLVPLGSFLFFASDASGGAAGAVVNYWGALVAPLMLAFVPAALARLLPSSRDAVAGTPPSPVS